VGVRGEHSREALMTDWTDEEHLIFDLAFALSKIKTKPHGAPTETALTAGW
jgi:hypothetical protein